MRHLYRHQLGGSGTQREVSADIVADVLLGMRTGEWLRLLRTALMNALEERHGEGLAKDLELLPIGLPHYPKDW